MLLWVGGLAVVLFVVYFVGVLVFAHKNPAVAVLEGAELIHWHQLDIAAKGIAPIPVGPVATPIGAIEGSKNNEGAPE